MLTLVKRYGYEYGIHTPVNSQEIAEHICMNLMDIDFYDSSWHNDIVDSIATIDERIKVLFPNAFSADESQEEFADFIIQVWNGAEMEIEESIDSLGSVILRLKEVI